MNPLIERLVAYPFERLNELKAGIEPDAANPHVPLSLGEPKHPAPEFVIDFLADRQRLAEGLTAYPPTAGSMALREAIGTWLTRRFALPDGAIEPARHVLPCAGTREAIFSLIQACVRPGRVVVMPNPFYQIYEGACLLAGAEPVYVPCTEDAGFCADYRRVSADTWARTDLVVTCSPGNPTGAVMPEDAMRDLLRLAARHGFTVAADECYSEVYLDEAEAPPGLLQAALAEGHDGFEHCVVFHSLSKRSNLPGLRSGFVAGDASVMAPYLKYRTYHGATLAPHVQQASALAWADESHVVANRAVYREKFDAVTRILRPVFDFPEPRASFYLWPRTPVADTEFAARLFREQNVTVLPGSFLGRDAGEGNPGANRVRIALVAETATCVDAAGRIARFLGSSAA